jgi:hypothetical protein
VDENTLERLFAVEPEEDPEPCTHGRPVLAKGWQELVSEVERCAVCFEVVCVRLRPPVASWEAKLPVLSGGENGPTIRVSSGSREEP